MFKEIKVEVVPVGASTSSAAIRRHVVLVDRPELKGGADQGPMGGELFLASVGGCFMSNLLAAMRVREAQIANIRVTVTGILNDHPPRYDALELRIAGECEDRELLRKLVDIADRGCIMTNTLRSVLTLRLVIPE
ncbi:MAG: OsmC family protein [Vicinamibacterales bacterium]